MLALTVITFFAVLFVLAAIGRALYRLNKIYYILSLCKRIRTSDGTPLESKITIIPGKTIFGNNFDVLNLTPELIFQFSRDCNALSNGRSYIYHFMRAPVYNITTAEDAEELFKSTKLLTKNVIYELLEQFLGRGLLISDGAKWHFRRKALTPAFHFNVLQGFLEIFKEETAKLIKVIDNEVNMPLELKRIIPEFTLNNVCETALGVKLDDIEGSERYRQSIHVIEQVILQRTCNPLMYYHWYFYMFGDYRRHKKHLQIAHNFSSAIIERKRADFQSGGKGAHTDEYGCRKRYAMLDTLLEVEAAGQIDHAGICEEVNTFMFEGYDTTSTCLMFTLFNLALHGNIQERCYAEISSKLNATTELSVFDFNNLQYLECVIKETLRMYPSVPFFGRMCLEECELNGLILPQYAQINVHIYDIMRDPKHFPNPNQFEPERFLTQNNAGAGAAANRHPFAFVPFSAGQRNCIGQKFALLEIKVLLAAILRSYQVLPVTMLDDLIMGTGLVLRSQQPIKVKFIKR